MTKEKVLHSLETMPNEFPLEDLMERLVFMQKVEEGLQQSERGEVTPLDEVIGFRKNTGAKQTNIFLRRIILHNSHIIPLQHITFF